MPRMRTIKPEFCKSETIAALSLNAQLHFVKLWTYTDDAGRGVDNAKLIKGEIWPLNDEVTTELIDAWQAELENAGRINRYVVDSKRYYEITNWEEHQKPKYKAESKCPPNPSHTHIEPPSGPDTPHVAVAVAGDVAVDVEVAVGEFTKIAERLVSTCQHQDKAARQEAIAVCGFLLKFIDKKVLDEEIGRVQASEKLKPVLPRYYLKPVREHANQRNILIPLHDRFEKKQDTG